MNSPLPLRQRGSPVVCPTSTMEQPGGPKRSPRRPPTLSPRRRATSLVQSAKKLASKVMTTVVNKKKTKKRHRSGSMEGSPRAVSAPEVLELTTPPDAADARATPPPQTGRPPRPPAEHAPRGLRKLAAVMDRLLLAHSVDDVVEEFFVTGLDAQRSTPQLKGARLDAEALRRACQLHGGTLRLEEARAAIDALGAHGAVSVAALLTFCEDRRRRLDGDTASESTVASATPPPPPLPGRHGSRGWLFEAPPRAGAPPAAARRLPGATGSDDGWLFAPIQSA